MSNIEVRWSNQTQRISSGPMILEIKDCDVVVVPRESRFEEDPWCLWNIDELLASGMSDLDILKKVLLEQLGWIPHEAIYSGDPMLVLDVDETISNSVEQHWKYLTKLLVLYFGWDPEKMPSYEEVCIANGTHSAYRNAAPSPEKYEDYVYLNESMRFNPEFNTNQKLIEGAREALTVLASRVLLYLTTRPEKLTQLTYEELVKHGFPDRKVMGRPDQVPLHKTSMWKVLNLALLSYTHKCPVTMIDDSVTTHDMIKELGIPQIQSILVRGPMTPKDHPHAQEWKEILRKEQR